VRLYRQNRTKALPLYVLIPPTECDTFWITTSAVDTFSLGPGGLNGSLRAGAVFCVWHVHPGPTIVDVSSPGLTSQDALRYYSSSGSPVDVQPGDMKAQGPITFFSYRPESADGRSLRLDFEGSKPQEIPTVHVKLQNATADFVFIAERASSALRPGPERLSADALRLLTSAICLTFVGLMWLLVLRPGVWPKTSQASRGAKPVMSVAAFAAGAKLLQEDHEEVVNTATFFQSADPV
jgi:hypothetical protein